PGDRDWPVSVDDLGDSAPSVLWTQGAASILARPPSNLVTITGARAATSYGEHVAAETAGDLVQEERIIVDGGAYGIEGATHRAALAAGGDTIAVLAGGVDRPYPAGTANSSAESLIPDLSSVRCLRVRSPHVIAFLRGVG